MRITKSNQEKNKKENYKTILKRVKKEVKGITLIALVVTIIVLLILAGVAISLTVGDNGLFRRAENAADTWQMAEQNEQSEMDEAADFIERYENGNKPLDSVTGKETTNSIVYDKYGNKVVVPAGFKIINPEDDATKGIVIEDINAGDEYTKGSQFVWIPIGNVYTDNNRNFKAITLGRYIYDENGDDILIQSAYEYWEETKLVISQSSENYYQEFLKDTYTVNSRAKDIESFILSSLYNKGFYIGRYEGGDAEAVDLARTTDSSDDNKLVCKQDIYPYNFITQNQASRLCKNMYNENFVSDIINSYAWDTAIKFIQTFSGDKDYSLQKGENTLHQLQKCGNSRILNEENSYDLRCNIYDMSGNTQEWTSETFSGNPCVFRGSVYAISESTTASRAPDSVPSNYATISTRPILYI